MALSEFDLIKKYFTAYDSGEGIELGIGDDCALLNIPQDKTLAITTDTQIESVHFFKDTDPEFIGYKSLLVNVSDLASMGAKPYCFTLSISLPNSNEEFLKGFAKGLFTLASKLKMPLIGGNTTKGELSITITAYGLLPKGKAMRRDLAKVGDDIYVTGTLGLPGLAVDLGYKTIDLGQDAFTKCYQKSMLIEDRCDLAQSLLNYSTCAIDISDGLVGDIKHILDRSNVGCEIDLELLPKPVEFSEYQLDEHYQDKLCLYGGGDYELLFTANPSFQEDIKVLAKSFGVKITRIGQIKNTQMKLLKHGKICHQFSKAFEHF